MHPKDTCSESGCARRAFTRGVCRLCYYRAYREANPERIARYQARYTEERRARAKPRPPCQRCGQRPARRLYCSACAPIVELERRAVQARRRRISSEANRIAYMNRRRATRITDLTPDYLIRLKDGTRVCPLCRVRLTFRPGVSASREVDHIVPIAVGGTHTVGNVRVICRRCNLARPKDGSDLDGWQPTLWATDRHAVPAIPRPIPRPATPPKPRGPSPDAIAKGQLAVRMREQGAKWREVCEALGVDNTGTAHYLARLAGYVSTDTRGRGKSVRQVSNLL